MFTKDHHKILQEISFDFSSTQELATAIGLPATLTIHLLEELKTYDFIEVACDATA